MAEQDELPVYILYIHTLVRKIYFTNWTGEELAESEFSPNCLPTDLIKEICNTTRDIRPESLITPETSGTAYKCPCRDPTNHNFGRQPYDLAVIGHTETERLHKYHARRQRFKTLESSNKI